MIPKKIHYCWFGEKPLTKEAIKCIESWKKYCPDYEIIEWSESNYDINKNGYTKYTFENKKYAFLSDYARLDVVYNEGGIYLDTDVEILKPLDPLLENQCYFGMEQPGSVATGLGFGAVSHHPLIMENKNYYERNNFLDKKGKFKKVICVKITTDILKKHGLKFDNIVQKLPNNVTVFSTDYFCPMKMGTNKVSITENTYSIHHYSASWKSNNMLMRKISYRLIPAKQAIKKAINYET